MLLFNKSLRSIFNAFYDLRATLSCFVIALLSSSAHAEGACCRSAEEETRLLNRGRYLARIGVCEACHTPPDVSAASGSTLSPSEAQRERTFKTNPDWLRYIDPLAKNAYAGGVTYILRFSSTSNGVVYSSNITPDRETGLGNWTENEIVEVIRTGRRRDGTALFLFPPHSFFENLAEEDAHALAVYLRSLPAIANAVPARTLPFPTAPATNVTTRKFAPKGRSLEQAQYLMDAIVGCAECHSHTANGSLQEFVGGDPSDPFLGVFRLGPDLPLRVDEKGFAAFPYPGYAVKYAPNLTAFGLGGPLSYVSSETIVRAMRQGIEVSKDRYGRPHAVNFIMMWQFYSGMSDDDAYSIADYLKTLQYVPHEVPPLQLFGEDWEAAFEQVFGESPSANDKRIFGKSQ